MELATDPDVAHPVFHRHGSCGCGSNDCGWYRHVRPVCRSQVIRVKAVFYTCLTNQ